MGEKRKQYTREFKLEAVRLTEESGRSKTQIARELGIQDSLLKRWKAQLEERPRAEAFPGNGKFSTAEEEVRRLRRELEQVKQERGFLRKTSADERAHNPDDDVTNKAAAADQQPGEYSCHEPDDHPCYQVNELHRTTQHSGPAARSAASTHQRNYPLALPEILTHVYDSHRLCPYRPCNPVIRFPLLAAALLIGLSACDNPDPIQPTVEKPALTSVSVLVPGQKVTIEGRALDQVNTLSVDGTPVSDFQVVSATQATFTAPALRSCETDGRTVALRATGTNNAAASAEGRMRVETTFRMEPGQSLVLKPDTLKCLQLPAADEDYVITALRARMPSSTADTTVHDIITFQTGPNPSPSTTRNSASMLANHAEMDRHIQMEESVRPTLSATASNYFANPIPFDPRYATAQPGDTVRFPNVPALRQRTGYCSLDRATVRADATLSYPVQVALVHENLVVGVDLRMSDAQQTLQGAYRDYLAKAAATAQPYLLPALKHVFGSNIELLNGGGGRIWLIVTTPSLQNPESSNNAWSGIGSDGLTSQNQRTCALASQMHAPQFNRTTFGPDRTGYSKHPQFLGSVIIHEMAHNAEVISMTNTPGAMRSTGWLIEPWAVAAQEVAARLASDQPTQADVSRVTDSHPYDQIAISATWGEDVHPMMFGKGQRYTQGALFLLTIREHMGEATTFTANARPLHQQLITRKYDFHSLESIMASIIGITGRTERDLLDHYALASATDDLVSAQAAQTHALPQIRSWNSRTLRPGRTPKSLARSTPVARTLRAGPAGYDAAYLMADGGKGISLEFARPNADPAVILRLTRLR